jgi:hypothetical protein
MIPKQIHVILIWGLALIMLTPVAAYSQTVDEIVAKHMEAIGGADRLSTIKSRKAESIISGLDGEGDIEASMYAQRPREMRVEYAFPEALVIMAFDGETAWSQAVLPNGQKKPPATLSPEKTLEMSGDCDEVFDDTLNNFRTKGHQIRLVGRPVVNGHEAFELELILKDGRKEKRFIDALSYLEIRRTKIDPKTNAVYEASFSAFKTWSGVTEASKIEVRRDGKPVVSTTIVSVEIGHPIDSALFEMPKSP